MYSPPDGSSPTERRAILDDAGQFEDNFTPTLTGLWKVVAQFDGDNIYAKSLSSELTFTLKEPPLIAYDYLLYIVIGILIGVIPLGTYFLLKRRKP